LSLHRLVVETTQFIIDERGEVTESFLIMIPAGDGRKLFVINCIYKAIAFIDTAGPKSRKILLEWFGFANAFERTSFGIYYQFIYSF